MNRLARQGCNVVIPFRDEYAKRYLKVAGDLGRVVFIEFDLRNTESIEESVRHSDIVYNLIGRDYPTKYALFEPYCQTCADHVPETSTMKMSTLKGQSGLRKPWPNTMWIGSFKCHPIMRMKTPLRSSSEPRCEVRHLVSVPLSNLTTSGSR